MKEETNNSLQSQLASVYYVPDLAMQVCWILRHRETKRQISSISSVWNSVEMIHLWAYKCLRMKL